MRIAYQINDICDFVGSVTAKCQLPLYGRWCDMTINSYYLAENEDDLRGIALSYGIRPLDHRELRGRILDASPNGILRLSRGEGGHRQYFEQSVEFPTLTGTFLDRTELTGNGVPAARTLIRSVLRGVESIAETIRQTIRHSFPRDITELALNELDNQFGQVTVKTLNRFIGELHWRLLLSKAGCDEQQLSCIEFMANENPPRFYDVNFNGESDIPMVGETQADVIRGMRDYVRFARERRARVQAQIEAERRNAALAAASDKARGLLRQICGNKLADFFEQNGYIVIKQNGYTFEIPANSFVRCIDPNGKRAELCIHTQSFQCNPIDEVVLAYLHIRHKLADYMKTAILHCVDPGFQRMPKVA